jgi:hypothetical protein
MRTSWLTMRSRLRSTPRARERVCSTMAAMSRSDATSFARAESGVASAEEKLAQAFSRAWIRDSSVTLACIRS